MDRKKFESKKVVIVPPKIDENNPTASTEGYYNPVWFMWFKKANNE